MSSVHPVQFYAWPELNQGIDETNDGASKKPEDTQNRSATYVQYGCPKHRGCEPMILQFWRDLHGVIENFTSFFHPIRKRHLKVIG